jgi:hypothetical protein
MSDERPPLRIIDTGGDPDLDMRGLRMWAVETAVMIVSPGKNAFERVQATAERLVNYVVRGVRNDA